MPKQPRAQLIGLPRDALAGLLLAAIAIPEQLATARLAGMPPEAGLFTFAAGAVGFPVYRDQPAFCRQVRQPSVLPTTLPWLRYCRSWSGSC